MLRQLESSGPKTVYTEDVKRVAEEKQLHGVAACQADDVLHKNWSVELVNSQPDEEGEEPWGREQAVDAFTLTHHDLEVCSNPLQYAMVLDFVNNLLLYVEPQRREANKRLPHMRFRLQLSAGEDHRTPILQLLDQVR
ncbi:hypothetical protein HPB51_022219 [Rhipicephalus microplus]|uniref:Uncharacterized protein n=1 Tax=Rhipicephalus microplus TaxID=6941 RepID=A0A9J6DCA3_RHIMP|nr:hypothetical protein HPB51_022219 [Rhipicephalus microplus]